MAARKGLEKWAEWTGTSLDALHDPRDGGVGDVLVFLMAPPDDDVGPVDVLVREPLVGVLDRDGADLDAVLFLQVFGEMVAQVIGIGLFLGFLLFVPHEDAERGAIGHRISFDQVPTIRLWAPIRSSPQHAP
jgi:hypothetical protein